MRGSCYPVPTPSLPATFWAYLAAFIDGEGSVMMCQNGPRLTISNTHKETLDWIQTSLDCGYFQEQQKGRSKTCYNLNFGSNAIRMILAQTIPYMHEKKCRSEILLDYLDTVTLRGGNTRGDFDKLRQQVKLNMANVL